MVMTVMTIRTIIKKPASRSITVSMKLIILAAIVTKLKLLNVIPLAWEAMPLTASGKVDRRALLESAHVPDGGQNRAGGTRVAAATPECSIACVAGSLAGSAREVLFLALAEPSDLL